MTPTNYIRLWIRAFRRRRIRKVLSKEFKAFFISMYNAQIKNLKITDYIISKLIPQYKQVGISYIIVIFFKIITLYILFLILYDLFKFIVHIYFFFKKFIFKQKLLYWYMILIDFEKILYKFKKIPRAYIKDTIYKHTIIRGHLLFINKYISTYNSVSCFVKQEPEFYEKRKLDWELFNEKVKRELREWRKTAFFYLIQLNYIRYSNIWVFRYRKRIRRFKFDLFLPYRRLYHKYALKWIRIISLNFLKVILKIHKIKSFFKYYFKRNDLYKNFLIDRFKKKNIYLYKRYGMRYEYFLLDYIDKIENVDGYIVEKEIKTDSLVYERVLNEKKHFDSLKGYGNIFLSIYFYMYKISHKIYFDRNHYIMYLAELELILKKKHFPEENFNITFKLKFWKLIKPLLHIIIRIYPYICKVAFRLKIIYDHVSYWIKVLWYFLDKIYVAPIVNYIMDKFDSFCKRVFTIVIFTPIGLLKTLYTFLKKKLREIIFIIWIILKGK